MQQDKTLVRRVALAVNAAVASTLPICTHWCKSPTCWKSCEMTWENRSTTMGLGGGGPCPHQICPAESALLDTCMLRSVWGRQSLHIRRMYEP